MFTRAASDLTDAELNDAIYLARQDGDTETLTRGLTERLRRNASRLSTPSGHARHVADVKADMYRLGLNYR